MQAAFSMNVICLFKLILNERNVLAILIYRISDSLQRLPDLYNN